MNASRCAAYPGPYVDDPGKRCTRPATARRWSGEYAVQVCESHREGPALCRIGSLYFGFSAIAPSWARAS